jgi:hypothetical protein
VTGHGRRRVLVDVHRDQDAGSIGLNPIATGRGQDRGPRHGLAPAESLLPDTRSTWACWFFTTRSATPTETGAGPRTGPRQSATVGAAVGATSTNRTGHQRARVGAPRADERSTRLYTPTDAPAIALMIPRSRVRAPQRAARLGTLGLAATSSPSCRVIGGASPRPSAVGDRQGANAPPGGRTVTPPTKKRDPSCDCTAAE